MPYAKSCALTMRSADPSQVLTVSTASPFHRTHGTSLRRWNVMDCVPSALSTMSHVVAMPGSRALVTSFRRVTPTMVSCKIWMELLSSARAGSRVGTSPERKEVFRILDPGGMAAAELSLVGLLAEPGSAD